MIPGWRGGGAECKKLLPRAWGLHARLYISHMASTTERLLGRLEICRIGQTLLRQSISSNSSVSSNLFLHDHGFVVYLDPVSSNAGLILLANTDWLERERKKSIILQLKVECVFVVIACTELLFTKP